MSTLGDYERIVVLGAKGLLGNALAKRLRVLHPHVVALTREDLDLIDPSTFLRHSFERALVFDAAARISGDEEVLRATNVGGVAAFVEHLREKHFGGRYVYVSTLSTADAAWVKRSPYVASKATGEQIVRDGLKDTRVIRVSYFFGLGGSTDRLLPRIAGRLLRGETVTVDPVSIYLTNVDALVSPLIAHALADAHEVNLVPQQLVSLESVVLALADAMGVVANCTKSEGRDADQSALPNLTAFNAGSDALEAVRAFGRAFAEKNRCA